MTREEQIEQIALSAWDRWRAEREPNFGPLREADIRSRIRYLVANWERLTGQPLHRAEASWREIVEEAIAQSFGTEAAKAVGWDVRLTIRIAAQLLEESNCHTERAALIEAARKMGVEL